MSLFPIKLTRTTEHEGHKLTVRYAARRRDDGYYEFVCNEHDQCIHPTLGPWPVEQMIGFFDDPSPIQAAEEAAWEFVACKDPEEYDVCDVCKARLRQFAYVIEGQGYEERPHPTEDDHYNDVEGAAEFCGGDKCDNPPSAAAEVIDQETTECCVCSADLGSRSAGFVCDDCGSLYCNYHADAKMRETDVCSNCRGEE